MSSPDASVLGAAALALAFAGGAAAPVGRAAGTGASAPASDAARIFCASETSSFLDARCQPAVGFPPVPARAARYRAAMIEVGAAGLAGGESCARGGGCRAGGGCGSRSCRG